MAVQSIQCPQFSVHPNQDVKEVLKKPADPISAPCIHTEDTLHLKLLAQKTVAAIGVGALVGSGANALSAIQMRTQIESNLFAWAFLKEEGIAQAVRETAKTRALWGALAGAAAGAVVATQTENQVPAILGGALAAGAIGALLTGNLEGVARYAVVGGISAFASSAATSLIKN